MAGLCTHELIKQTYILFIHSLGGERVPFGSGYGLQWNLIPGCAGDENDLADCPINMNTGGAICTHNNDLGVICHDGWF